MRAGWSEPAGKTGRYQTAEPLGEVLESTTPENERAASLRDDTLAGTGLHSTRALAKPDASRFGGKEQFGTTLDDEAIEVLGHDLAAEAILRLDERDPRAGHRVRVHVQETVRCRQTGDASAQHDDITGARGFSQLAQIAVHPPSTVRVVPVIIRAAGPARKTIAAATSSGVASLPAGVRPRMSLLIASFSSRTCVSGVSTNVGQTAFTLISVRGPLDGKHPREIDDFCLGRAIRGAVVVTDETHDRGDVDDAAARWNLIAHDPPRGLSGEEQSFQVRCRAPGPRLLR